MPKIPKIGEECYRCNMCSLLRPRSDFLNENSSSGRLSFGQLTKCRYCLPKEYTWCPRCRARILPMQMNEDGRCTYCNTFRYCLSCERAYPPDKFMADFKDVLTGNMVTIKVCVRCTYGEIYKYTKLCDYCYSLCPRFLILHLEWAPKKHVCQSCSHKLAERRDTPLVSYKDYLYQVNCKRVKRKVQYYGTRFDDVKSRFTDKCEICKREVGFDAIVVDHCHVRNKFRGFLCAGCNSMLGSYHDSVDEIQRRIIKLSEESARLNSMVAYLNESKSDAYSY